MLFHNLLSVKQHLVQNKLAEEFVVFKDWVGHIYVKPVRSSSTVKFLLRLFRKSRLLCSNSYKSSRYQYLALKLLFAVNSIVIKLYNKLQLPSTKLKFYYFNILCGPKTFIQRLSALNEYIETTIAILDVTPVFDIGCVNTVNTFLCRRIVRTLITFKNMLQTDSLNTKFSAVPVPNLDIMQVAPYS